MSTRVSSDAWIWPDDVLAFAAEAGLTPFLEPVLAMTQRLFPGRVLRAALEVDWEIPDA
jgi:hypothetical protein